MRLGAIRYGFSCNPCKKKVKNRRATGGVLICGERCWSVIITLADTVAFMQQLTSHEFNLEALIMAMLERIPGPVGRAADHREDRVHVDGYVVMRQSTGG